MVLTMAIVSGWWSVVRELAAEVGLDRDAGRRRGLPDAEGFVALGEVRREALAGDLGRRPPQRPLGGLAVAPAAAGDVVQEALAARGEQPAAQDRLERLRRHVGARERRGRPRRGGR